MPTRSLARLSAPQIQSNALAALEALDLGVAQRVFEEGCITGDRINGLCDGVTGDWYVKFDTFHPAADMGLPVTRVISRVLLQVRAGWVCVGVRGREGVDASQCAEVRVGGGDPGGIRCFTFGLDST